MFRKNIQIKNLRKLFTIKYSIEIIDVDGLIVYLEAQDNTSKNAGISRNVRRITHFKQMC